MEQSMYSDSSGLNGLNIKIDLGESRWNAEVKMKGVQFQGK